MAKTLEPIDVGTITPVRRVRSVTIHTLWDDSETPAQTRVGATFDYEIVYPDAEGKQLGPPKPDGSISLDDAELRAQPGFMEAVETLSAIGDAVKEDQEQDVTPATNNI